MRCVGNVCCVGYEFVVVMIAWVAFWGVDLWFWFGVLGLFGWDLAKSGLDIRVCYEYECNGSV